MKRNQDVFDLSHFLNQLKEIEKSPVWYRKLCVFDAEIILNTTLKVFLSELQNFPPQNVTYSNRLYRGLLLFYFIHQQHFNYQIKEYSVIIFYASQKLSKRYIPVSIDAKNDNEIKISCICNFFSSAK